MPASRTRHTRKKRRQQRALRKYGRAAVPVHKGRSGRTGSMQTKKHLARLDGARAC